MNLTSRSLLLALSLPVALSACVTEQNLGDPQETEGPPSETEDGDGPTSSDPETAGETDDPTEGETEGDTDSSIHDRCIELVWSCPNDDLVCLPEGLCVPCAGEGESPGSAEGGHCCEGLVQSADGLECVADPDPNGCLAPGDICGYSGVTQDCCEGSVCNPDTDLCEPDGSKVAELCADYTPPPFDNCAAGGESSASVSLEGEFFARAEFICTVAALDTQGTEESIQLQCGGDAYTVSYDTVAPHLVAPVAENDDVVLSLGEVLSELISQPSFALRSTEGELLLAYADQTDLDDPLPISLPEMSLSYGGTGCAAFDAGAVVCDNDGELILAGYVDVSIDANPGGSAQLQAGGSSELEVDGRTYDVTMQAAERIVCWDESCAGDGSGPFDHLEMLIVAR